MKLFPSVNTNRLCYDRAWKHAELSKTSVSFVHSLIRIFNPCLNIMRRVRQDKVTQDISLAGIALPSLSCLVFIILSAAL